MSIENTDNGSEPQPLPGMVVTRNIDVRSLSEAFADDARDFILQAERFSQLVPLSDVLPDDYGSGLLVSKRPYNAQLIEHVILNRMGYHNFITAKATNGFGVDVSSEYYQVYYSEDMLDLHSLPPTFLYGEDSREMAMHRFHQALSVGIMNGRIFDDILESELIHDDAELLGEQAYTMLVRGFMTHMMQSHVSGDSVPIIDVSQYDVYKAHGYDPFTFTELCDMQKSLIDYRVAVGILSEPPTPNGYEAMLVNINT